MATTPAEQAKAKVDFDTAIDAAAKAYTDAINPPVTPPPPPPPAPPPAPAPQPPVAGTVLAQERGTFTVAADTAVKFGTDTRWNRRVILAGIATVCDATVFGGDPAFGANKSCISEGAPGSLPPAPPPPPPPSPPPPPPPAPPPSVAGRFFPTLGDPDYHFSTSDLRVPKGSGVQAALSSTRRVRCDSGHYAGGLTMKTGQKLVGVPGNDGTFFDGRITIEPGSSDIDISGVSATGGFYFPPSSLVTKRVTISMVANGEIKSDGACLENCFFMSFASEVHFNNNAGGYTRGCRWYRPITHGSGSGGVPVFQLVGPNSRISYGNSLLDYAPLGSMLTSLWVEGQRDFGLAGMAMEDYPNHTDGSGSIWVDKTTNFMFVGFSGRNEQTAGIYTNADYSHMAYSEMRADGGKYELSIGAQALCVVRWNWVNHSVPVQVASGNTLQVKNDDSGKITPTAFTAAQTELVRKTVAPDIGNLKPWAEPAWRPIPEPLGIDWRTKVAAMPDDTQAFQAQINAQGLVETTKVIATSAPITLKAGTRLIFTGGGGIVSKTGNHPLMELDMSEGTGGVQVMDGFFQNGTWGYRQSRPGQQLNGFAWVGNTWLDMSVCAMGIDNSYAWDGGMILKNRFKRCAAWLKQNGTSITGTELTISYIDKVNWVRCWGEDCGSGIVFTPTRANNLDTMLECYFRNFTGPAIAMTGGNNTHGAYNCVIENCGGDVACDNHLSPFMWIGGRIVGSTANKALTAPGIICEGAVLDRGAGNALVLALQPSDAYATWGKSMIINTDARKCNLGGVLASPMRQTLVVSNSLFGDNPAFNALISGTSYDGKGTIPVTDDARAAQVGLVLGTPIPQSRICCDLGA